MPLTSLLLQIALGTGAVHAGEIKILSAAAVQGPLSDVSAAFEHDTANRVTIDFATAGQVDTKLESGKPPDIVINASDRIAARAKAAPGSVVRDLGTVRVGVAASAGAPRPDLSTVASFRAALLQARTVAYSNPAGGGTTGVHFARVIEALGITDAMAGKRLLAPNGLEVVRRVSSGEAELGITQVSEILHIDAATYVGLLPEALQLATTYTAWLTDADNAAARQLLDALTGVHGRERFRAAGFETPERADVASTRSRLCGLSDERLPAVASMPSVAARGR